MAQEFVEYGALDLYLKRGRSVSVSWKLDIAKQLASVLTFLVSWMLWRVYNRPTSPAAETHILLGKSNVCFNKLKNSSVSAGAKQHCSWKYLYQKPAAGQRR